MFFGRIVLGRMLISELEKKKRISFGITMKVMNVKAYKNIKINNFWENQHKLYWKTETASEKPRKLQYVDYVLLILLQRSWKGFETANNGKTFFLIEKVNGGGSTCFVNQFHL